LAHRPLRPGRRRALDKGNPIDALIHQIEKLKATVRARIERLLKVFKR